MRIRVTEKEFDRVMRLIAEDIADIAEELIEKKIKQKAYRTGRFMRSVSSEVEKTENGNDVIVGSVLNYPNYLKVLPEILGPVTTDDILTRWSE